MYKNLTWFMASNSPLAGQSLVIRKQLCKSNNENSKKISLSDCVQSATSYPKAEIGHGSTQNVWSCRLQNLHSRLKSTLKWQPLLSQNVSLQVGYAGLTISLLICTLESDFEGGRKLVLQTWIFFSVGDPEKKVGLYYKPTFFQVAEPLFCHLQNHF